MRGDLGDG
jgi:hypothetical protein